MAGHLLQYDASVAKANRAGSQGGLQIYLQSCTTVPTAASSPDGAARSLDGPTACFASWLDTFDGVQKISDACASGLEGSKGLVSTKITTIVLQKVLCNSRM